MDNDFTPHKKHPQKNRLLIISKRSFIKYTIRRAHIFLVSAYALP